jgi:drug/metabolite transporter (DMT)-like permease
MPYHVPMPSARIMTLTVLAMLAFAGNSLLCRLALKDGAIDPASFTTLRLLAGTATLWLVARWRYSGKGGGHWLSGLALFVYAAGFSFAYQNLSAATGALLLFGAVQVTMISRGVWAGERLRSLQVLGVVLAAVGLLALLLPGLAAPPLKSALLMLVAGCAWGVYSLRGKGAGDPTRVTAGNFLLACPLALGLSLLTVSTGHLGATGVACALASGALTSGLGYALWYAVLPRLKAIHAGTVQLSVPPLTAFGGVMLLGEPLTLRLALASVAIIGGIALVLRDKSPATDR